MPDEEHAQSVPLFRAYIRRKPSGLLLVTVLSTLLPRPLFRMYPAELGEAEAVERSVGHALETLHQRAPDKCEQRDKSRFNAVLAAPDEAPEDDSNKSNRQSHALLPAVNVVAAEPLHRSLPCGPEHEHSHADKREEQHASEGNGEFKQLGCDDEVEHGSPPLNQPQEYADYRRESSDIHEPYTDVDLRRCTLYRGVHDSPHGLHQPRTDAAVRSEEQAGAEGYAVKQHLRLRVVWQGLLTF